MSHSGRRTPSLPVTPWFPEDITPVRRGVYQVKETDAEDCYAYWDGERFGYRCWEWASCSQTEAAAHAYKCRELPTSLSARISWRGLARKP